MTLFSDLDLQSFISRALLAISQGKVPEAERSTLRDSKQFPYHEDAHPDLLLLETRFGHDFDNTSQRYVLYGEKRHKALWRLSVETWWNRRELEKWGIVEDAQAFLRATREQGHRINRIVGLSNREATPSDKPHLTLRFEDNGLRDFKRFSDMQTVSLRLRNGSSVDLCEAAYYGGAFSTR